MKLLLVALCVILSKAAVDAQLIKRFVNGIRVNFGSVDSQITVGKLSPKYRKLTNTDITAAKNLVSYIENLRQHFETGTSVLPPLEPFTKTEIEPFSVDTGLISGRIALRDVVLQGLKDFQLSSLEIRVNGYRVDFNITFPSLEADVEYTADTTLSGVLPLSFAGHVNGRIVDLNLSGAARIDAVRYLDKTVFQLRALDVRACSPEVGVEATGLNLGEAADVLDRDDLGVDNPLIVVVKQKVSEAIAKVVAQEINEVLLNHSASKILQFLYTGKLNH